MLRLVPDAGVLVPQLRSGMLAKQLSGLVSGNGAEPVDAEIRLLAGKPRVIPAKPGVSFEQSEVDAAFLDLVVRPEGERVMEVPAAVVEPEFTTEDAEALGIKKEVSVFTTYFPYAEYRNINIGRAAELVDGTIVAPGETFSLNGTVGERTAENGFTTGFVISNGIFKEDLGGGVSQMATTTFNAAFFAGMTDVEHKTHSFYIDRYPVGREATVAWPTVDLAVPQRHAVRRAPARQGHPQHALLAGRGDGAVLLDEVLGHHDQDRRALQLHLASDADPRHRGLLPQLRVRRLRHRHLARLATGRLR